MNLFGEFILFSVVHTCSYPRIHVCHKMAYDIRGDLGEDSPIRPTTIDPLRKHDIFVRLRGRVGVLQISTTSSSSQDHCCWPLHASLKMLVTWIIVLAACSSSEHRNDIHSLFVPSGIHSQNSVHNCIVF